MSEEQAAGETVSTEKFNPEARTVFLGEIVGFLDDRGVRMTPLLKLRIETLATLWTLLKRTEAELNDVMATDLKDPENAKRFDALSDRWLKFSERTQKVVNDIEDHCAKAGTPIDKGLADKVKPLLQRTEGIIESLLAKEAPKTRKRAPKKSVDKTAVMDTIVGP